MKNEKWFDNLETRQDFIDALPMFCELEAIMHTSLHIARRMALTTKQRVVVRHLKERTNIPVNRLKEMVKQKDLNELDLSYARAMYFSVCEENGYLECILGLNEPSDESIQVFMFLDWWDSL